MGTTMVGAIITTEAILVFNIGDSRAYFVTSSFMHQITQDQNMANYIEKNKIEKSLFTEIAKSALTSALGPRKNFEIDYYKIPHQEGYLLLASDGFYTVLNRDKAILTIMSSLTLSEKCEALMNQVRSRLNDNATFLLAHLVDDKLKI